MTRGAIWTGLGLGLGLLGLFLLPMLAPQPPDYQFREWPNQPPSRLTFGWAGGSRLPIFAVLEREPGVSSSRLRVPLTWFPECRQEGVLGGSWIPFRIWGTADCAQPVFLLGSDSLGRDIFSRTLSGVRFSLLASLTAIIFTLLIGTLAGALSGYYSGWADRIIMRVSDLFLAVPGLFFILGLRVLYPVNLSPLEAMMMMVVIFVVISWATVSRVVRGQVLAIREREHVLAARSIGASDFRILVRHVLPFCRSVLVVQATFFLPLFLVAEISLSFLGVGVQEPAVSLGLLIRDAASLQALLSQHWKWAPALVAFLLIFGMNLSGDRGRLVGKVRAQWW